MLFLTERIRPTAPSMQRVCRAVGVLPISLLDISPRPAGRPAARRRPQDLFVLPRVLYIT